MNFIPKVLLVNPYFSRVPTKTLGYSFLQDKLGMVRIPIVSNCPMLALMAFILPPIFPHIDGTFEIRACFFRPEDRPRLCSGAGSGCGRSRQRLSMLPISSAAALRIQSREVRSSLCSLPSLHPAM